MFPLKFLYKFLIQLIYPRYFRYSIHHLEIVITLTKHYGLITNPSSEMLSVVVILTHRGRDNHSCIDLSVYRFNVTEWKWNRFKVDGPQNAPTKVNGPQNIPEKKEGP